MLRVFVMGCPRGGTTLTQRLVAERLGLYTLPETRFFANMIGNTEERMFPQTGWTRPAPERRRSRLREALGRSTGREYVHVTDLPVDRGRKWGSVRAITARFTAVLDETARSAGCAGWLEKSPSHVHYAPAISRLLPDAWLIHVVRDPQQAVASIWDAAAKYRDPWGMIYGRVERAVDTWNAATRSSAAMVGRPRQIFLPYDALAAAPEAVLDAMVARMGVARAGAAAGPAVIATADEAWKSGAVDGAVAPAASKWDTALTGDERARAGAMIAPVPAPLEAELDRFRAVAAEGRAA